MANKEMEIKTNEAVANEAVVENVPAETLLDKVKKFRLGKTAKKILIGVGIAAVAAVGTVVGVNVGKNLGEGEETSDGEVDWEQDHDFVIPSDEEIENITGK